MRGRCRRHQKRLGTRRPSVEFLVGGPHRLLKLSSILSGRSSHTGAGCMLCSGSSHSVASFLPAMNHGRRVGLQYFIAKLFRVELFNGTLKDSRGEPQHFLNSGGTERSGGAEHTEKTPLLLAMPRSYKRRPPGLQLSLIDGCLPLTRRKNQQEIESRHLHWALMIFHNFPTRWKLYVPFLSSEADDQRERVRGEHITEINNRTTGRGPPAAVEGC